MRGFFCRLALAGGVLVFASQVFAEESKGDVKADHGSVAIGGSPVNSPITIIGVPPEKLEGLISERTKQLSERTEEQKQLIGLLKDKLQLNERQVEKALEIVGERNVPPERLS